MQIVEAIWSQATLHLWLRNPRLALPGDPAPLMEQLRQVGMTPSKDLIVLRLPATPEDPIPPDRPAGTEARSPETGCDGDSAAGSAADLGSGRATALNALPVDTCTIRADDAFGWLLRPGAISEGFSTGDSLRYWSGVARWLAELLVGQRFVPAVHRARSGRLRGFWRVVVDDGPAAARLARLIEGMPPVCRSMASESEAAQAAELVENFLWTTTDAIVRRCLAGDDMAVALLERGAEAGSPPATRWLASLIGSDPWVACEAEEGERLYEGVASWLGKLEPASLAYGVRTCLRLHLPEESPNWGPGAEPMPESAPWRLTVHAQARHDAHLLLDAERLGTDFGDDPRLLDRPFADAQRQLRVDLALAAAHVPTLAACAAPDGPWSCELSLAEAYAFVKEAVPRLEAEGLRVFLPRGWRAGRSRLQLWLDLSPDEGAAAAGDAQLGLHALIRYDWRLALGDEELSPEEWQALTEAKLPLVRFRGQWTEVDPAQLRAAAEFVGRHPSGRMTVLEALRRTFALDEDETGVPLAGLRGRGWVELLLGSSERQERVEDVPVPAEFRGVLRPYQHEGLNWLAFLGRLGMGACLADDMGLGKTIQLIALLLHERENGPAPGPTLLVVPMSLVGNWHREIARFGPSLRVLVHHGLGRLTGATFIDEARAHDVVISTYGLAHRDHEYFTRVEWLRIALDEAQNIKNPTAKQAVAVRAIPAVQRVALTGTPLENRLAELWSIIDFLNPGYLGSVREFRRRFAAPIERQRDERRAARLRQLVRPFVLRRLKSDPHIVEDLPPKLEMTVFCNLTKEQAGLYDAVVQDMLAQIDSAGGMRRRGLILATLVKLKQICNHPAHFLGDGSPLPQRSGKCERLTEMLEEVLSEGDRALVFTQFREMGSLLQEHLRRTLECEVLFLHGGTPAKERNRLVDCFQSGNGNAPVFLLSLKAGGFGLNLTAANHVFHFDRWWNPAVEDQATDRTHRIGQTRQVQVHKFVSIGTLEERIAAMMDEKRNLAERIIGGGEEWLTELTTDALRELFALSREAVVEE